MHPKGRPQWDFCYAEGMVVKAKPSQAVGETGSWLPLLPIRNLETMWGQSLHLFPQTPGPSHENGQS